jgi:hypothetical protein
MATIKVRWTVDELANVMTLFDQQKVYWTASITAPIVWTEATGVGTRVALQAGVTSYLFDHLTGDPTYYYSVAYYNSSTTAESNKSDPMYGALTGYSTLTQSEIPQYLAITDLYTLIGSKRVKALFDDSWDGDIDDEMAEVYKILRAAEDFAASFMLNSWGSDAIVNLANNDRAFKNNVAWVALEFASERRPEFTGEQGQGQFLTQYERSVLYFKNLSRAKRRSIGELVAGTGANEGGSVKPTLPSGSSRFTFAPDDDNPTGHGGF